MDPSLGLLAHNSLLAVPLLSGCIAAAAAARGADEQLVASIQAGEALPLPPFLVLSGHAASLTPY